MGDQNYYVRGPCHRNENRPEFDCVGAVDGPSTLAKGRRTGFDSRQAEREQLEQRLRQAEKMEAVGARRRPSQNTSITFGRRVRLRREDLEEEEKHPRTPLSAMRRKCSHRDSLAGRGRADPLVSAASEASAYTSTVNALSWPRRSSCSRLSARQHRSESSAPVCLSS